MHKYINVVIQTYQQIQTNQAYFSKSRICKKLSKISAPSNTSSADLPLNENLELCEGMTVRLVKRMELFINGINEAM